MQVSCSASTMHRTRHAYYIIIQGGPGHARSMPTVSLCCGFPPALPALWLRCPRRCKGKWRTGYHRHRLAGETPGHTHRGAQRCRTKWDPKVPMVPPSSHSQSVSTDGTQLPMRPWSSPTHTKKLRPGLLFTHPGCRQISSRGCEYTQELACSTGSSGSAWDQNGSRTGWEDALRGTRVRVVLVIDLGAG